MVKKLITFLVLSFGVTAQAMNIWQPDTIEVVQDLKLAKKRGSGEYAAKWKLSYCTLHASSKRGDTVPKGVYTVTEYNYYTSDFLDRFFGNKDYVQIAAMKDGDNTYRVAINCSGKRSITFTNAFSIRVIQGHLGQDKVLLK